MNSKKGHIALGVIVNYIVAFVVGVAVGFKFTGGFVTVPFLLLSIACIFFASQSNVDRVFAYLPYLIYSEIQFRAYVRIVPYLFIQYLMMVVFLILFLRGGTKVRLHSKIFFVLLLFVIIEFIDINRAVDANVARGLTVNSAVLLVVSAWASYYVISPRLANVLLKNIKYASIYLCGIVLAAYIKGDVHFLGYSSIESTNGLAPVQISGYLGFSCAVFFFSIMNRAENLTVNIACFCLTAIVMILSFSRGGIYFVGVIIILYLFFNRNHSRSYVMYMLLIPVGIFIYWYVTNKTNGMIEDRYSQEGSSGRDVLVKIGWQLFTENPLAGVGTGNFNSTINTDNLYAGESGAHNEFIRVAAEHGVLGLVTYWGFFIALFFEILGRSKIQREYAIYFLAFFCMITVHNGLKISLQPLLLLLAVGTPSVAIIKRKTSVPGQPQLAK